MSPVPKKSRLEKSDDSPKPLDSDPNYGVINFEVDKVSTLDCNNRYSTEIEVGGVPWKSAVRKEKVDDKEMVDVSLYAMNNTSKLWSIEVNLDCILLNSDSSKNISESQTVTYRHDVNYAGVHFHYDACFADEQKGFVKDDKITVEIRFSILNMEGIWIKPRFKSQPSAENRSDIIVMTGDGKPALVNKQSLLLPHTAAIDKALLGFECKVSDVGACFIRSPEVVVHGMSWCLGLRKLLLSPYMAVYLNPPEGDCNIWSIDVLAEFLLVNRIQGGKPQKARFAMTFNHETGSLGMTKFILWDDLINEEKGFVKDGKFVIAARITLSNIVGIRTFLPNIDLSDPNDPRHDITLVVEGQKIYVGKQILAFHSPFFNAMFYGNHSERNKKEIELKDIELTVFTDLLALIYLSYRKITDDNAESLLKMADYFQINLVIDKVEQHIIDSIKWDIPAKLKLSDQNRLVKLQDHCLDTFKTVMDVMNLQTSDVYKSFSDKLRLALLDKSMKLSRANL